MNINEILGKYTEGKATLAETNDALKQAKAGFHLDPNKNKISPDEIEHYGLLDTGTGYFDKVEIRNFELAHDDMGVMTAFCYYMGKLYKVEGKKLIER